MNMGRENPDTNERFSMSVFCPQHLSGGKRRELAARRRGFQENVCRYLEGYAPEESHVGYVTNGVHMPA